MLNTFINKLPEYVNNTTKRVHSEYFQIGAVTGRLSCRNPNMQQQPSRGDIAKHWKEIFVADDGNEIVTADYSQIELRIVGEAARDKKYIEAYNNKLDLHRRTAAVLFKVPEDQVTKTQRSMSKSVNFGLNYGMWAGGLVKRLKADTGEDVTEQEAKQYIKDFQAMYPEVTAYLDKASKESIKNSYVRTMAGRLIRFEPAKTLKEQSAIGRLGKNNPIQGFCADLLKIAMRSIFLKLEPLGVKFVATVHDELVFECKKEQTDFVMKTVEEEMSKAGDKYFKYIPCVAEVFKAPYWHKD